MTTTYTLILPSRPLLMPLPLLLDPPRPRLASLSPPFFSLLSFISEGPPSFPRLRFFPTVSQEFWGNQIWGWLTIKSALWLKFSKNPEELLYNVHINMGCMCILTYCVRGALQQEINGSVYVFVAVMEGYHALILSLPSYLNQLWEWKPETQSIKFNHVEQWGS